MEYLVFVCSLDLSGVNGDGRYSNTLENLKWDKHTKFLEIIITSKSLHHSFFKMANDILSRGENIQRWPQKIPCVSDKRKPLIINKLQSKISSIYLILYNKQNPINYSIHFGKIIIFQFYDIDQKKRSYRNDPALFFGILWSDYDVFYLKKREHICNSFYGFIKWKC